MAFFYTDQAIRQLPELLKLKPEDLFLVSQEGQGHYYSRKLKYQSLSSQLNIDFDLDALKLSVNNNTQNIFTLSTNVSILSSDLYDLSVKFLSNDILTRLIPEISAHVIQISNEISDMQPIDRIVDLGYGLDDSGRFMLQNFAINECHTKDFLKFKVPDWDDSELCGKYARHLIIDLSVDDDIGELQVNPRFYNNCKYISTCDLTSGISAGQHVIFSLVEIEPNVMYVTRDDVLSVNSGIDENEVLVVLKYFSKKLEKNYTDVFDAISGTYISSDYLKPHYLELSDIEQHGLRFNYWVNTDNPQERITHEQYQRYYLDADVILSAVYSQNKSYTVYFYGTTHNDGDLTAYTQINSYFPVFNDDNIHSYAVESKNKAESPLYPNFYISADHKIVGWYKDHPHGFYCDPENPDDWNINISEELEIYRQEYYAQTIPKKEYEEEIHIPDGFIDVIPEEAVVLDLENEQGDDDWQGAWKFTNEDYPYLTAFADISSVLLRIDDSEEQDDDGHPVSIECIDMRSFVYQMP